MLMDHSDAAGDGSSGSGKLYRLFVYGHGPAIGVEQTVENVHQCRLAGPIFSNQRMDFSLLHQKSDIIVCGHQWELLGNMMHFNGIFSHGRSPTI